MKVATTAWKEIQDETRFLNIYKKTKEVKID